MCEKFRALKDCQTPAQLTTNTHFRDEPTSLRHVLAWYRFCKYAQDDIISNGGRMCFLRLANRGFLRPLVAILLVALIVPLNTMAQSKCVDIFLNHRITKINNWYITENAFNTDRTLDVYSDHFPFKTSESLKDIVLNLPTGTIWVDMGAGEARALADGLHANPRIAEGVAIAYNRPSNAFSGNNIPERFRYLEGDFVENMARNGKLDNLIGKVSFLTDVYGPISYSPNLPDVLQVYFDLLSLNGMAVFNLMWSKGLDLSVYTELRPLLTNYVNKDGINDKMGVIKWLSKIPGVEVVEISEFETWSGPDSEKSLAIKVRKVSKDVIVPETLRTVRYEASAPPVRIFEIVETSIQGTGTAGPK